MTSQFCSVRVHKAKAKSFLTDKDWEWGEEEVGRQEGFRASVLTWLCSSSSRPAVVVIIIPSYHRPDSSLLVTVPLLWSMDDGNLRLTVGCYQWLQYSSHSFIIWDNEPLFPPLTVRLRSTLLVCFLPLFFPSSHNCTVLSPPKPSPFVADFPPHLQSYLFNWISKRALWLRWVREPSADTFCQQRKFILPLINQSLHPRSTHCLLGQLRVDSPPILAEAHAAQRGWIAEGKPPEWITPWTSRLNAKGEIAGRKLSGLIRGR